MRDFILYLTVRLCVALLCLQSIVPAHAADFNWAAPTSGSFITPGNWNPAGPLGSADRAIFNLGSAGYTVSGGGTVSSLVVGNDTVTFGGFYTATSPALPAFEFGNASGDVANVTFHNGQLTGGNDAVGYAAGSNATTTLDGTRWNTATQYVGYAGTGELDLINGATVAATQEVLGSQSASVGTLTMAGNSSLQVAFDGHSNTASLIIGASGTGTLTDTSGLITVGNQLVVAQASGSQGSLTLNGTGAKLTSPTAGNGSMTALFVGQGGTGSMTVEGGASAAVNGSIWIGINAGSNGSLSVTGSNSLLSPRSQITGMTVGNLGTGSFSVTDGAKAEPAGLITLGNAAGSQGNFMVDGAGSLVTKAGYGNNTITGLTVGNAGRGIASITGGGQFQNAGAVLIGSATTGNGSLTVDGAGSQLGASSATIGSSGTGTFAITNGGTATIGSPLLIATNSGSSGTVTIDGIGTNATFSQSINTSVVGGGGTGELDVTGGALATSSGALLIGRDNGSNGTVKIDGAGSTFKNTDQNGNGSTFIVGQSGTGALTISGGGALTSTLGTLVIGQNAGSQGTVLIDGAGSKFSASSGGSIIVGQSGTGSLTISHGGTITPGAGQITIGKNNGAQGTFTLENSGSSVTSNAAIFVGGGGIGALDISAGASATARAITLTTPAALQSTPSSMSLDGVGTTLTSTGDISNINGAVSITGGAKWSVGQIGLGTYGGSYGQLTVDGANSACSSNSSISMYSGKITVSNGGSVSAVTIASQSQSGGIDNEGGSLTATTINSYGPITNTGMITASTFFSNLSLTNTGTIKTTSQFIAYGTLVNNGTINGPLTLAGTLSGTGTVGGILLSYNGTISPGNSPGTMTAGNTSFGGVHWKFEINAATGTAGGPIGWDLLNVTHFAHFFLGSGQLTIDVDSLTQANLPGALSDFDPTKTYQWTILTSGQGIDNFDINNVKVDTSGFANNFTGAFSVLEVGNNLVLQYRVPEPSSVALAAVASVLLLARRVGCIRC